jgi:cyclic pyranopterin phosphate synthase
VTLADPHGRIINYLRLSVTDRCNMRCVYCMPPEGVAKLGHGDVLRFEELHRIARAAVACGIEKIRVTGGEPLVRRGIIPFLRQLAAIPGLTQLVLTTNGLLLPTLARELRDAGVQRLNVSLDSLRPATFAAITRSDVLPGVLEGIAAAEECGLPVKLNMVVMGGINDDEIMDLAALTLTRPLTVRFIEYMPSLKTPGWQRMVVPCREIVQRLGRGHDLIPLGREGTAGPAREYRIDGGRGTIGVIAAVSDHFCASCNRIRVTATGMARGCLFAGCQQNLVPLLQGDDDKPLEAAIRELVASKPPRHQMEETWADHDPFAMSTIGG